MSNLLKKDFSTNHIGLNIRRSKFPRPSQLKTSFNVGDLIPIYFDEVLPGDTFQMDTAFVARMSTPIKPTMDNLYLDISYFYVPNRLVWRNWKAFQGENVDGYWAQPIEYEVPQILSPIPGNVPRGFAHKSLADYLGVPIDRGTSENPKLYGDNFSVTALPFRAYALIWNEFYRDENLQEPCHIYLDDTTRRGSDVIYSDNPNVNYVVSTELGGALCRAAKFHDYFTSALPEPQKGGAVELPLGDIAPLQSDGPLRVAGASQGFGVLTFGTAGIAVDATGPLNVYNSGDNALQGNNDSAYYAGGLSVDLSQATAANINQIRMAFALEQVLELDARGGTRYNEILHSHFGVTSPDARLQRPEYLGGKRVPLFINQVLQTSASADGGTPQGNTAGFSYNSDKNAASFTKSFVEHGMIIGLAVVRAEHTYQQGLNKFWFKKRRFDFYMPEFAHIGEQPIYNKEIYVSGTAEDDEPFGYQEAWADYRYKPSLVTGEMRSTYPQSLDVWHYADYYDGTPVLSNEWIQEPTTNIDRTLAVTSQVSDQFIADFYFDCYVTRPMPVYSYPGLTRL